jgi:predicted O-linked N-acetylglucosamine transferase (SPINDLY family)
LARYKLADVCLDTFPYNGHTTTSDALLAGVPVVTMMGSSFASRVAGSLLNDVGLMELACSSYQEYFEKTLQIINNADLKQQHKNRLDEVLQTHAWPPSAQMQAFAQQKILEIS